MTEPFQPPRLSPLRTSEIHPIRVDWLPGVSPGAMGLTCAPGQHGPSSHGAWKWWRDLHADLEHLVQLDRTTILVCLAEDHELVRLDIPNLVSMAESLGLRVLRLPIRDNDVRSFDWDVAVLLEDVHAAVAQGGRVVIHGVAGLGRSTMIAGGCFLVERGTDAAAALGTLKALSGYPNVPAQVEYVRKWGRQPHKLPKAPIL